MIQRIETKKGEKTMNSIIRGIVEAVNGKGLKVNSRWYNFSKFLSDIPEIKPNDEVEFLTNGGFIVKFLNIQSTQISKPNGKNETAECEVEEKLLNALRSAASIASILEKEVSIKFSAQDIIKLAITLFIQNS